MPLSRIELAPEHGDQTLTEVNFVAYGAAANAGGAVLAEGLDFAEGREVVTSNLVRAAKEAGEGGAVCVLAAPSEFTIGYAANMTAYIDRSLKLVSGEPMRYAQARGLLAFYIEQAAASSAGQAELRATARAGLEFRIASRYVLGSFLANANLRSVLKWIEVAATGFEPLDRERVESALSQMFECREPAQAVVVPTMVRDMVNGTVEAVVLSMLRDMRWEGLALLGYRFRAGRDDVPAPQVAGEADFRRRIDEYSRRLASTGLFEGELAWLKAYAATQLHLMRVELDGAGLEA